MAVTDGMEAHKCMSIAGQVLKTNAFLDVTLALLLLLLLRAGCCRGGRQAEEHLEEGRHGRECAAPSLPL